jgi:hypothetical protein
LRRPIAQLPANSIAGSAAVQPPSTGAVGSVRKASTIWTAQRGVAEARELEVLRLREPSRHVEAIAGRGDGVELAGEDQGRDRARHRVVLVGRRTRCFPERAHVERFADDEVVRDRLDLDVDSGGALREQIWRDERCLLAALDRHAHALGVQRSAQDVGSGRREQAGVSRGGEGDHQRQDGDQLGVVKRRLETDEQAFAGHHHGDLLSRVGILGAHDQRLGVELPDEIEQRVLKIGEGRVTARIARAGVEQRRQGSFEVPAPLGDRVALHRHDRVENHAADAGGRVAHRRLREP